MSRKNNCHIDDQMWSGNTSTTENTIKYQNCCSNHWFPLWSILVSALMQSSPAKRIGGNPAKSFSAVALCFQGHVRFSGLDRRTVTKLTTKLMWGSRIVELLLLVNISVGSKQGGPLVTDPQPSDSTLLKYSLFSSPYLELPLLLNRHCNYKKILHTGDTNSLDRCG